MSLQFVLPVNKPETFINEDREEELLPEKQPPALQAIHKQAAVLFLERVYGIPDQMMFFRLLEDCFLPDLRAATSLATVRFIRRF